MELNIAKDSKKIKKKQVESLSEGKGASYDAKGTKVH
jgi:hypothetical protein